MSAIAELGAIIPARSIMKLCANFRGPIPTNDHGRRYRVVHILSGMTLTRTFYADDETGEIWRYVEDWRGDIKLNSGEPEIEKLILGPGAIRIEEI
jgi:hypothetical protein